MESSVCDLGLVLCLSFETTRDNAVPFVIAGLRNDKNQRIEEEFKVH